MSEARWASEDAFAAAADYISEHGWCQHRYMNDEGNVCALGALAVSAPGVGVNTVGFVDMGNGPVPVLVDPDGIHPEAYAKLLETVGPVSDWNDAPERTAEDVILTFKRMSRGESP